MAQAAAVDPVAIDSPPEAAAIECPPTDLWSDEPPLESDFHRDQIDLLIRLLRWWWRDRNDVYISGNLTVYYNQDQLKTRDFRGPDFFVVLGTEKKDRKSWVVWGEQGLYPNLILEILSDSTKRVDKGLKKDLYQDTFRTPDYFWFDPNTLEFQGFHLVDGLYQAIQPTDQGRLWSHQLELYLGVFEQRLRFFTAQGELIPSPEERAEQAEQEIARLQAQCDRGG
ncbi:MAG: Uma2 family endonuclease [Leptolyngbyaceae cyanobacterium]